LLVYKYITSVHIFNRASLKFAIKLFPILDAMINFHGLKFELEYFFRVKLNAACYNSGNSEMAAVDRSFSKNRCLRMRHVCTRMHLGPSVICNVRLAARGWFKFRHNTVAPPRFATRFAAGNVSLFAAPIISFIVTSARWRGTIAGKPRNVCTFYWSVELLFEKCAISGHF